MEGGKTEKPQLQWTNSPLKVDQQIGPSSQQLNALFCRCHSFVLLSHMKLHWAVLISTELGQRSDWIQTMYWEPGLSYYTTFMDFWASSFGQQHSASEDETILNPRNQVALQSPPRSSALCVSWMYDELSVWPKANDLQTQSREAKNRQDEESCAQF